METSGISLPTCGPCRRYGGEGAAGSGFYFGGNVGYGWGQKEFVDNFSAPLGADDGSVTASGVVGGLQGGYNYQIDAFLLGSRAALPGRERPAFFPAFRCWHPRNAASPRWLADAAGRLGVV
jgi:hypothetical protein